VTAARFIGDGSELSLRANPYLMAIVNALSLANITVAGSPSPSSSVPFRFRQGQRSTLGSTSQTFSSVDLGPEHPRRRVFVASHWTGTLGNPVASVAGVPAFRASCKSGDTSTSSSCVFVADVPTGATVSRFILALFSPSTSHSLTTRFRVHLRSVALAALYTVLESWCILEV
jgi:hypothetical protein